MGVRKKMERGGEVYLSWRITNYKGLTLEEKGSKKHIIDVRKLFS